ncbi:hypothetical protein ACFVS2_26665 [Brevibacillus sp. NPDC058079]|uniref:hypothetical protein n=1 Tax=Brevibacillus sp. NPDC058079 TaxID=3346330 RepID=UPI0036F105C3
MEMRVLKTKITKILKEGSFPKVVIIKSSKVKGYHTIYRSGFQYTGNEIRWYSPRGGSTEEDNKKVKEMYTYLTQMGFKEFIKLDYVGTANISVINLTLN